MASRDLGVAFMTSLLDERPLAHALFQPSTRVKTTVYASRRVTLVAVGSLYLRRSGMG
jgi:hypothetical protein